MKSCSPHSAGKKRNDSSLSFCSGQEGKMAKKFLKKLFKGSANAFPDIVLWKIEPLKVQIIPLCLIS